MLSAAACYIKLLHSNCCVIEFTFFVIEQCYIQFISSTVELKVFS